MSGQAVLCLSAVRNGCNAKRDPLCQEVLSQILKHMVVDEVLLAAKAKSCNVRSSPLCMCLTAAFMLDSAPAAKSKQTIKIEGNQAARRQASQQAKIRKQAESKQNTSKNR